MSKQIKTGQLIDGELQLFDGKMSDAERKEFQDSETWIEILVQARI